MRKYLNHIKRIEKKLQAESGQPIGSIIGKQSELILQYLRDEITADEFDEQSLAPDNELTPEQAEYQKNIFNKYLKENDINGKLQNEI